MNQGLFAAALALAWFAAVNLALSAVVAVAAWLLERVGGGRRFAAGPDVLLALKLLPGAGALLFTAAIFVPAHWIFEPVGMEETVGYTLGVLCAAGASVLIFSLRRAVRDTWLTRRLERDWETGAVRAGRLESDSLPVYRVADDRPIISLAGLTRPRVFIGRRVIDLFFPDELDVSLAHEAAHREACDNLKRVAVSCSPDFLALFGAGRRLERRWRAAVEFAADARAVGGSEERAVSLASALLKVARLSPVAVAAPPGSALYDGTLLRARIDRLLTPTATSRARQPRRLRWSVPLAGAAAAALAVVAEAVWLTVHLATEDLIRFLP